METLVKRVQIGNYYNEHQNLPVDEAIARFEKLSASQRRAFGIQPSDSLELFIRVLNDVCGKDYFPSIGKNGLRCHFTIQDFITGKVDALTFIETFTHQVAIQAHKRMAAALVQNVPLFRFENNLEYVWKPQSIFHHYEGHQYVLHLLVYLLLLLYVEKLNTKYVPVAIDTGQVSDNVKKAMRASDFSKTADQQRRAKYIAFTSTEASTAFWNGLLPDSKFSQAAANYYLKHLYGQNIDDDAQNLPVYDVNGNKLTSTHILFSSATYKPENWMNLRVVADDICV